MCNFFSLCSDGRGKIFYFNSKQRKRLTNSDYFMDSHTSIADYYGYKGMKEDKFNKWEYNPLTKTLIADQMNTNDDTNFVKKFCDNLNFKTIVPELIIKPVINPKLVRKHKVTKKDIDNLKKWIDACDSVRDSIASSIRDFVSDSVCDSVCDSIWDYVADHICGSIRNSISDSVRVSVWGSVYAYLSSFFDITYEYDYSPCIKLWERGFIPSFDGKVWRLHQGENMDVVFELK